MKNQYLYIAAILIGLYIVLKKWFKAEKPIERLDVHGRAKPVQSIYNTSNLCGDIINKNIDGTVYDDDGEVPTLDRYIPHLICSGGSVPLNTRTVTDADGEVPTLDRYIPHLICSGGSVPLNTRTVTDPDGEVPTLDRYIPHLRSY